MDNKDTEKPSHDASCLMTIWNNNCGSLPKIKLLTENRMKQCRARWKEFPDQAYWIDIVKKMSESKFLSGRSRSGWVATFDFFIRPDTHVKVSEGSYSDNRDTISWGDIF